MPFSFAKLTSLFVPFPSRTTIQAQLLAPNSHSPTALKQMRRGSLASCSTSNHHCHYLAKSGKSMGGKVKPPTINRREWLNVILGTDMLKSNSIPVRSSHYRFFASSPFTHSVFELLKQFEAFDNEWKQYYFMCSHFSIHSFRSIQSTTCRSRGFPINTW